MAKKKINSKAKGKLGELEFAKFLQSRGYKARRGQQYSGGSESPDVVCDELSEIHFEVKRVEKLNIYKAYKQACEDSKPPPPWNDHTQWPCPVVAHRKNGEDWLLIMSAKDFFDYFHRR